MSIKPLPHHYAITANPSVYDEEAMTALELSGRIAGKVNEVVDDVNEQNRTLDDMKNKQIPEAVTAEFSKNVNNGTFDRMIDTHAGELTQRITNLESNYTVGSTTADAELIDIRANADGQNYDTAGDAVRATFETAKAAINHIAEGATNNAYAMKGTPVEIGYTPSTIISGTTGELTELPASNHAFKTARIDATELNYYYIKARINYGNAVFAAYDSAGKVLDIYRSANEASYTEFDGYYHTPKNTAYLLIAWHNNDSNYIFTGHCYKIEQITVNDDLRLIPDIITEFNRLIDSGTGVVYRITGTPVDVELTADTVVNNSGGITDVSTSTIRGYTTAKADVNEGKLYHIHANTNWGNATYAFYDVDDKLLLIGDVSENTATYIFTDGVVIAPSNAKYIRVGFNSSVGNFVLEENIKMLSIPNNNKPWVGKKWVCVGDSLTEKNTRTSMNYHDYIANETGITVVNMGKSGSGYAARSAQNEAFYQRILNVPTDADVITIFGSFNDIGKLDIGSADDTATVTTIGGCINHTLDTLFNTYPLARVGIVTPTPWDTLNPYNYANHPYVTLLKEIAAKRGIPCLDLFHTSGLRPWEEAYRAIAYSKDDGSGTHPDENGHAIIAPQFREFLAKLI